MISPSMLAPADPRPSLSTDDLRWQAVLDRRQSHDFFYAVQTTGIVCRPGCASRTPLRANVRFYTSLLDAEAAGFRPCQRCRPQAEPARNSAVTTAAEYIAEHLDETPSLDELAEIVGLSATHLQRTFRSAMGVSPNEYAKHIRMQRLADNLRSSTSVTDAIYAAGFSSSSRAYENTSQHLGMKPSAVRKGGEGETIRYATAHCDFDRILVAATARGVCAILLGDDDATLVNELQERFPRASVTLTDDLQNELQAAINTVSADGTFNLPLDLRATAFQLKVWQALRAIPRGETRTYSQVASEMGRPTATRAVARACATNPVALAIPCHRVIGSDGSLTGYRWGVERKRKLLEREQH